MASMMKGAGGGLGAMIGRSRSRGTMPVSGLGLAGVALAILLLPAAPLAAQTLPRVPRLTIGVAAGGGAGLRGGAFPVYTAGSDCGEFNGASTRSAWGEVQLGLPGLLHGAFGVALALGWENQAMLYKTSAAEPFWVLDRNGAPVRIDHDFHYNTLAPLYRLSTALEFRIMPRIALSLGPWFGYRSSMVAAQTENVIGNYRFAGDLSSRGMDSVLIYSSSFTTNHFALGALFGVAAELPIGERLLLKPQIALDLELTSTFNQIALPGLGARAGLGIAYDLTPDEHRPDTIPPPAPVPERAPSEPSQSAPVASAPQRPTKLTAGIELYGVDDRGERLSAATVHVFRVVHRSTVPLITTIAFDRSSSLLPARYPRLSRARAAQFAPDSLAGLDLEKIALNSLNVLGWRLRENSSARVTLRGSSAKGEPSWLAYARMETLRSYLEEVWGIDKGRIDIQPANDDHAAPRTSQGEGGRGVSIASDSPEIIGPIVLTSRDQNFEPPLVRVVPRYDAGAGIKEWRVTLSHEGTVIARYVNGSPEGSADPKWRVPDDQIRNGGSYLVAELTVEDSLGGRVAAQAQSPMAFDRNVRIIDARLLPDGRERTVYTLFAGDSAAFDNRNGEVFDEIAARMRSGGKLSVVALGAPTVNGGKEKIDRVVAALRAAAGAGSRATIAGTGGTVDPETMSELAGDGYRSGELAVVLERDPVKGGK